ncbi:hypothetical protein B0H14DRAFT_3696647 [Mycena olivaceomarginata]|nr:hypothetical protein B0H14DRAFT_3696647 [Mycena olivaceomarginata]
MPAGVPLSSQHCASNVKSTSSLSNIVNITRTKTRKGRHGTLSLSAHAVRILEQEELAKEASRRSVMTQEEQTNLETFLNVPDTFDYADGGYEDEVLRGKRAADISHAGEGLEAPDEDQADEELLDMLEQQQNTRYEEVPIVSGDLFIASAYMRQGLMPSTPHHASVITVRTLEVFHVMQLRCPRLGIQVFVRGLCDLHVVAPRPYLGAQFSTTFDVYLSLRAAADQRMKAALGRDIPNWQLKNTWPACLYELEGEPKLKRRIIVTQDGNNSLKRFGRHERVVRFDGMVVPRASKERYDHRQAPGDVFLPRSDVEEWAKDEVDELMKGLELEAGEGGDEGAGCEERWENMKEDITARAWGLYDEMGIFPAPCRHGFVLVVVDMVQSGELAKYQGLTIFIANKYRRTLKIKQGLPALHDAMRALNVSTRDVFKTWLTKEKEYLQSMKKEPEEETMEMDYYQKLVNLHHSKERLQDIRRVNVFVPAATNTTYAEAAKQTRPTKNLATVQDLELRLGIETRWVAGGEEWAKAALMVKNRSYQRALDQLQGLVVARMFELAKMNMSGTGYKLHKHIVKALQVRSKAVKTALQKYNDAAAAMDPPKPELTWEKVVEYALAEFDLLREGREDIRNEPWALPAGQVAMDRHFKMLRANEEIERLNLEIPRLLTYMADEREFLIHHEECLRKEGNTALAHQVRTHRLEYGRFDDLHRQRLIKLAKEPGFTASLSRGVSVSTERRVPVDASEQCPGGDVEMPDALDVRTRRPQNADEGEDEEEEDDMDAIAEAFENIVRIAHDAEAAVERGRNFRAPYLVFYFIEGEL